MRSTCINQFLYRDSACLWYNFWEMASKESALSECVDHSNVSHGIRYIKSRTGNSKLQLFRKCETWMPSMPIQFTYAHHVPNITTKTLCKMTLLIWATAKEEDTPKWWIFSPLIVRRKWGQNWPRWEFNIPQEIFTVFDSLDGVF